MGDLDFKVVHDTLVELALEAGKTIKAAAADLTSSQVKKNTADPVTETDRVVEARITSVLRSKFASAAILGEESHGGIGKTILTDQATFIIDPIDGTTNFIHGFPFTCVSLGLCVSKFPVVGVVYNPITGALYSAIKGAGAFTQTSHDGRILGMPKRLPLKQPSPPLSGMSSALVAIEWGSDRDGHNWEARLDFFARLGGSKQTGGAMVRGLRSTGSAAMNLCLVAAGELDAAWEAGAWAWDVCAGWAILEEAGGRMIDLVPSKQKSSWADMAPAVDGRTFFGIRAASDAEQTELAGELWAIGGARFRYDA